MVMVEGMAMEAKGNKRGPQEDQSPKLRPITPLQEEGLPIGACHPEGLVVNRKMLMEMVEIKVIKIRKGIY